jgi:hypothetical protein
MTLLVAPEQLVARRPIATGALAPLASGLRRELEPLLVHAPDVPTEKALLSRAGGRCDRDGALLAYDPHDARHRCPQCGRELTGELHDRFRLYWHQLWLAERVLHSALLGALLDDARCRALAAHLLDAYATQYLRYPNRDNALGPSRPFFSTYLESIWLLQLAIALDLLESTSPSDALRTLGGRVRDQLVAPSAALIASFDEGMSNRQVWNNAALAAAGVLLGERSMFERAVSGPAGLRAHLESALLSDGSWYEGENYHLFAHRGLWYGIQLAETNGYKLPPTLEARFREGFAAPFRTLLPDFTFPSRRDSPYAVSTRQPRFAESCELGLARGDDVRLVGMLARLYDPAVPRSETGRASSSADVERNVAATGLSRADLSWRALLWAREELPPLTPCVPGSDLLSAQGIAVLRRDQGAVYVALDYGHSGGGHGHPDRLNLLLVDGEARWFDDPGTGSYVDPSLHWYRSTLAHTAPLVDGHSQPRVHGRLLGFDDDGKRGWVSAEAALAQGLWVTRSLHLREDFLVDVLEWESDAEHEIALPLHGVDLVDEHDAPLAREAATLAGSAGTEDGFSFLRDTARIAKPVGTVARVLGTRRTREGRLGGWIAAEEKSSWWSSHAPDVPNRAGLVPLLLVRTPARRGRVVGVWSWRDAVRGVEVSGEMLMLTRRDGTREEVALGRTKSRRGSMLDEVADTVEATSRPAIALPASFDLGRTNYRRSEESWADAGRPHATVAISYADRVLTIDVDVRESHRIFIPVDAENPLDNEPGAINGDGLQLYVGGAGQQGGWLMVPWPDSADVGVRPIEGWGAGLDVRARWRPTSAGYTLSAQIALPPDQSDVALDVIVNETAPGRLRRRGQLVLSGAQGEFAYLRGDRHDRTRLLRFILPNV